VRGRDPRFVQREAHQRFEIDGQDPAR
jgi:hypothetical protein